MCERCGLCFNNPRYLKAHMRSHMKFKKFCCHVCGRGCSCETMLINHLANTHQIGEAKKIRKRPYKYRPRNKRKSTDTTAEQQPSGSNLPSGEQSHPTIDAAVKKRIRKPKPKLVVHPQIHSGNNSLMSDTVATVPPRMKGPVLPSANEGLLPIINAGGHQRLTSSQFHNHQSLLCLLGDSGPPQIHHQADSVGSFYVPDNANLSQLEQIFATMLPPGIYMENAGEVGNFGQSLLQPPTSSSTIYPPAGRQLYPWESRTPSPQYMANAEVDSLSSTSSHSQQQLLGILQQPQHPTTTMPNWINQNFHGGNYKL